MIIRALETQLAGGGFSFVEILTMCPTGWFIETQEAPAYLDAESGVRPRARRAQGRPVTRVQTSKATPGAPSAGAVWVSAKSTSKGGKNFVHP